MWWNINLVIYCMYMFYFVYSYGNCIRKGNLRNYISWYVLIKVGVLFRCIYGIEVLDIFV